ncbi:MAG TPA: DUF4159 domain-containing protein [Rhodospirillales bacterium]|nr:DUF4159 domain-containing protein [Rhodospirillales bacterium]
MLSLGALSFAAPWALAAFALLPVLWWFLRLTPPAPMRLRFPPIRFLLALTVREETSASTPWWLVVLRLIFAGTLIAVAAHPLMDVRSDLKGTGPLVLVVDDGWAAARNWPARQVMLANFLDQAEREGRAVMVATTAPASATTGGAAPAVPPAMSAEAARRHFEGLQPKPWPANRPSMLAALGVAMDPAAPPGHVVWLSDGLDDGTTASVARDLARLGAITLVRDPNDRLARVLRPPEPAVGGLKVRLERVAAKTAASAWLRVVAEDGTPLDRIRLDFADDASAAETMIELPAELRNKLARIEIENETTAASVVLLDERWRRRPVGLVSGEGALADQPLLSAVYYLNRALEPFTEVRQGTVSELLRRELAVMILADPGRLEDSVRSELERWIADGGVVVRFAGPRLAEAPVGLLPVRLRPGDRIMGGSMSWGRPATLAPFPETSPFAGLAVPEEVTVQRQVLAEPSLDLAEKTWAALSDGTPLVSAEKRAKGWVVLVHTTANATWSNLALSGAFVEMLERLVGLSQGVVTAAELAPLPPLEIMDGFGRLGPVPAGPHAIEAGRLENVRVGPRHPPGYYGQPTTRRALNLTAGLEAPAAIGPVPDVDLETYDAVRETDLRRWFVLAAFVLALVDLVASMAIRQLFRFGTGFAAAAALVVAAGAANAQTADVFALAASLETRLAYVITDDAETDETSRAGLRGLGMIVKRRTAAELGEPIGVIPDADELSFFPLIYWPVTDTPPELTRRAITKLNRFLRNGGTILFDTRESGGGVTPEAMAALAGALDIPPLMPLPPDHVLTRSYYLLRELPGRWTGGTVWIERTGERINDGVSSVIVGGRDWSAAWAMDELERPLFAVIPGGERQRELAYRFGINLVMYVLTGNYKSDQVHLPSILQRLDQ